MKANYKIKFYHLPFTQMSDNRYTDINKIEIYKLTDWIIADQNGNIWNWLIEKDLTNIFKLKLFINVNLINNIKTFNFVVIDFGDAKNIFNIQKVGYWLFSGYQLVSEEQLSYDLQIDVIFTYGSDFLNQIENKKIRVNSAHLNVLKKYEDKLKSVIFEKNINKNLELQSVLKNNNFKANNFLKNDNLYGFTDPIREIIKLKKENVVMNKDNIDININEPKWLNTWQGLWRDFFKKIYIRNPKWTSKEFLNELKNETPSIEISNELDLYNLWFDRKWKYLCFLYTFFYLQTADLDADGYTSYVVGLLNADKVDIKSTNKTNFSLKNPNIFPLITQNTYNNLIQTSNIFTYARDGDYFILQENSNNDYIDGDWKGTWNRVKHKWDKKLLRCIDFQKFKKFDNGDFEIITKEIIFGGRWITDISIFAPFKGVNINNFNVEVENNKTYAIVSVAKRSYRTYLTRLIWNLNPKVLDYHNPQGANTWPFGRSLHYINNDWADGIWENFYKTTIKSDGSKTIILTHRKFRTMYSDGAVIDWRLNINWNMTNYSTWITPENKSHFEILWSNRFNEKFKNLIVYYRKPKYNPTTKKIEYFLESFLTNSSDGLHIKNLDDIIRSWFQKHQWNSLSENLGWTTGNNILKTFFAEHSNFFFDVSNKDNNEENNLAKLFIDRLKETSVSKINDNLNVVEVVEPGLNNVLERLIMRIKNDKKINQFYIQVKGGSKEKYLLQDFNKILYQNLEYNLRDLDETKIYNDYKSKNLSELVNSDYGLLVYTPHLLNYHKNLISLRVGDNFIIDNYDVINDITKIYFQQSINGEVWIFDNELRKTQSKIFNTLSVPITESELTIQKKHFQKELDVEVSKIDLKDKQVKLQRLYERVDEKYGLIRSGYELTKSLLSGFTRRGVKSDSLIKSGITMSQQSEHITLTRRAYELNLKGRELAHLTYQNVINRRSFNLESFGVSDAQSVLKDDFHPPIGIRHFELGDFDKFQISQFHHLFGSKIGLITNFSKYKYMNRILFNYLELDSIQTIIKNIPTPFCEMLKVKFSSGVRLWNGDFDRDKLNWQKDLE